MIIVIRKWIPQQDLLAHPHLAVFVTHGGLLSVQVRFSNYLKRATFSANQTNDLEEAG